LLSAFGCSSDDAVIGERCPHPSTGKATIAGNVAASMYGTSCAPCDADPEFDERGCPVLVTFESCGGRNICLGSVEVAPPEEDDAGAEDGGQDGGPVADGGPMEDGGAD
jgi:hypothetical protein